MYTPKPRKEDRIKPRKPMNGIGPRTRRRNQATAYLRKTIDPTYCEVKLPGCTAYGTDWSHTKKSRNLVGDDWEQAVRSCRACHNTTELWSQKRFQPFLEEIIARRN